MSELLDTEAIDHLAWNTRLFFKNGAAFQASELLRTHPLVKELAQDTTYVRVRGHFEVDAEDPASFIASYPVWVGPEGREANRLWYFGRLGIFRSFTPVLSGLAIITSDYGPRIKMNTQPWQEGDLFPKELDDEPLKSTPALRQEVGEFLSKIVAVQDVQPGSSPDYFDFD